MSTVATTLETHHITSQPFEIRWTLGLDKAHQAQRGLGHVSFVEMGSNSPFEPHLAIAIMNPLAMKEVMQTGLASNLDVQGVRLQMSYCADHHNAICLPAFKHGIENLMVIDCERRTVVRASVSRCCYIALSYVWGSGSHNCRTDSHNGVLQDLLLTIEDSISLTMALGYKYLWVDRYVSHLLGLPLN